MVGRSRRGQLAFGPRDEKGFTEARDELVDAVAARTRGDGWVASHMLDLKWRYLDGDLARWTRADLDAVLLELLPAKVVVDQKDVDVIVPHAAVLLDELDRRGVLEGERMEVLEEHLVEIADGVHAAMHDPAGFGIAKTLATMMAAEGVDVGDAAAVQAFMERFNAQPEHVRRALLPLPQDLPPPQERRLPALVPASDEELAAAARATQMLQWLDGFVAFVGSGRKLTQKGNLTLADGRALVAQLQTGDGLDEAIGGHTFRTTSTAELGTLHLVFRLARAAGFVKVRRGKVEPTKRAGTLATDPVGSWLRAFDALLDVGILDHHYDKATYFVPPWLEALDDNVPELLMALYSAPAPVDIEDLADGLTAALDTQYDGLASMNPWSQVPGRNLRTIFRRLEQLGAVTVTDVVNEPAPFGYVEERRGSVTLTELGKVAVQRLAERSGVHAPSAGAYRGLDAAALLDAVASVDPSSALDESLAWLAARDPGEAVAELAAALDARPYDPQTAMVAFGLFGKAGPQVAGPAVSSLRRDDELGALAALWLIQHDLEPHPTAPELVALAAVDVFGPEDAATAVVGNFEVADQLAIVVHAAGRGTPAAVALLDVLGRGAGSPVVAKAARKELFRLRSRRASGH